MNFLEVVKYDREGACFDSAQIARLCCKAIDGEFYFKMRGKAMNKDLDGYTHILESAALKVSDKVDELVAGAVKLKESVKRSAGKIKDAHHKLADGIAKIEKTANFDRLERYGELLERAESAMTALAELENSGKLDKIAGALK